MILSVSISFIIILVSAAIPIVHFIAFPLSSLCLFFPLLIILKYTSTFGEIGWGYAILISLILSGYIWFGSTIGALVKFWTSKD